MQAQQVSNITGEYYLRGVMETAAGFLLKPDSSFEFFFSYGALDRSGKGTWALKDNTLVLNSPKPETQSFELSSSRQENDEYITIKIADQNAFFLSYVYAIIKSGDQQLEGQTNNQGILRFPKQAADSITILFEFAPEKTAVFTIKNKTDNYFEFRFSPTVMDVYFENQVFSLGDKEFRGGIPVLKPGEYHFMKN